MFSNCQCKNVKVTNNGFSHFRSQNEAFHKLQVLTGFLKMGYKYNRNKNVNRLFIMLILGTPSTAVMNMAADSI